MLAILISVVNAMSEKRHPELLAGVARVLFFLLPLAFVMMIIAGLFLMRSVAAQTRVTPAA
ncbi:hypothetical protein [Bradyrhizobium sp. CB3481]|uniref:hypothetical protein n=1 Tax=Bradyrhizobium sp. CB3481 TaxID=3039158 RepID=UPI0024B1E2AE|nr:hypothetical protein [Bradyrhizobium sp. CB3481]WFU14934.1 hypothetical protein QA643_28685 [Bradyrhizobium sp. CB3481]